MDASAISKDVGVVGAGICAIRYVTASGFLRGFGDKIVRSDCVIEVPACQATCIRRRLESGRRRKERLIYDAFHEVRIPNVGNGGFLVLCAVTRARFVKTCYVALWACTGRLQFGTILRVLMFHDGGAIREVFRGRAVLRAICDSVLTAVVRPGVRSTKVSLTTPRFFNGNAAAFDVFSPGIASALIQVDREGVATLQVEREDKVGVRFCAVLNYPLRPTFRVFRLCLVTVCRNATGIAMGLVRVRAILAKSVEDDFRGVKARFFRVANFAKVISYYLSAANR